MTLGEVKLFFLENDDFCIVCHAGPDGDTIGSSYGMYYALKKIGKRAKVICADPIPQKFDYLLTNYVDEVLNSPTIVTMDTADIVLLGDLKEEIKASGVDLNIDHHIMNVPFAKKMYLNTKSSSNCENVLEVILEMEISLDKNIANALYTGIITDTGCFKYENVNSDTHRHASILIDAGADYDYISFIHFDQITREYIELEQIVMGSIEYYFNDICCMMSIDNRTIEKTGAKTTDVDILTAKSKSIKGIDVSVIIKQKTDLFYKVSFRTSKKYEANKIAGHFGGGGHIRAAGCAIDGSLEDVKNKILNVLNGYIK